ncbi:MAG TPA: hypothetical protein VNL16_13830 [Chloroflexota bacterium]|nr:hypothetical protein [Chloroflexota bacterium]
MKLRQLLEIVGDAPVFETGLLLAGDVDPDDIRRQLSRWTRTGQIYQLRRGCYALAPPLRKVKPHPFVIANRLVRASYVSCESALAHHGMIPEYVPVTTSVTTRRPGTWDTPLGRFTFHHVQIGFFRGYEWIEVDANQDAFIAAPEKALLDLIYLRPGADSPAFLTELRLQNLEQLSLEGLHYQADLDGSPKLRRAAAIVDKLAQQEAEEYVKL